VIIQEAIQIKMDFGTRMPGFKSSFLHLSELPKQPRQVIYPFVSKSPCLSGRDYIHTYLIMFLVRSHK
jgi:hypothetical protein